MFWTWVAVGPRVGLFNFSVCGLGFLAVFGVFLDTVGRRADCGGGALGVDPGSAACLPAL